MILRFTWTTTHRGPGSLSPFLLCSPSHGCSRPVLRTSCDVCSVAPPHLIEDLGLNGCVCRYDPVEQSFATAEGVVLQYDPAEEILVEAPAAEIRATAGTVCRCCLP